MAALDGSPLDAAAAVGVELEKLKDTVYAQWNQSDTLLTKLSVRNDLKVSERMCRIPLLIQPGSTFAQFVPDSTSDSLGTGGGEVYVNGVCSPVYFSQSCSVSKEAEWATDSSEKSVVDVYKKSFSLNLAQFRKNIDSLLSSSSGAGDLTTVKTSPPATVGQDWIAVANANVLQPGCTYQVFASIGGSHRGDILIKTADLANNIVYLELVSAIYYPAGTAAGDTILVSGAAGTAAVTYAPDSYTSASVAASLNGVPAINVNSSTGTWFGLARSAWPGVLNAEYVNGNSGALTPQMIMTLQSLVTRVNGDDEDEDFLVVCNTEQRQAWESLGVVTTSSVATAFVQQEGAGKGSDTRMDYLKKDRVATMAGRELLTNVNAIPNRVDFLNLKYLFRTEVHPVELYNVDGITAFPLYHSGGGVAPVTAFYFVTGLQTATSKPRGGAFIDTLAIPSGL